MNDADYKNFKNVPGAGWAWLFLRRNPEFRRRCAELANYDDLERRTQERLIARDFGLRRFKHCDERYGAPGERRPLFNPMARWRSPESKDEVLQHTAIVRKGQVLLRFDVRPSLIDEKSLMVQLASALKILEMERKKLHEAEADSSLKTTSRGIRAKGDHRRRIIWLRILDAHNNNIDPMEALAKIAPMTTALRILDCRTNVNRHIEICSQQPKIMQSGATSPWHLNTHPVLRNSLFKRPFGQEPQEHQLLDRPGKTARSCKCTFSAQRPEIGHPG